MAYNINLEPICGDLQLFIKNLPFRDKKSESFLTIDYKPLQFLREDIYVGNIPHDKTVVVKRQAEEVGKRAPHKLRAQRNLKLKTRARLNKRARKQKRKKALESNLRLS